MTKPTRRQQEGTALLLTVMLLFMMALIGFAALDLVMADQQVAGFQNRKKVAFYAAEAGIAQTLESLQANNTPTITAASLGDSSAYPFGQPSYAPDASAANPVEDLGQGPMSGMSLNIGQNGGPLYQLRFWRIRVQGQAPGGSIARIETVSTGLATN
jgi:Tfp pilus assembly protein PilX